MSVAPSLFGPPASPVLTSAADWVGGTLFGGVAVTLCVIAVAFVGLMLMTGRLAVRDGLRVAIGCFVLLGAPIIAAGLHDAAFEPAPPAALPAIEAEAPQPELAPAPRYDPYAGASLRRD